MTARAARLVVFASALALALPASAQDVPPSAETPPAETPAEVPTTTVPPNALVPEAAPLVDPTAGETETRERFRDTTLAAPPPTEGAPGADGDLAYGAYQRGYYLTAFHRATQRLERNADDAAAMTLLGELYAEGLGIAQDLDLANDWYALAAREGDANALFALAMNTIEGRGRDRDPEEGRRLLERAAEAGHPRAAYNLALVLLGTQQEADIAHAATLMRAAAEAEVAPAQHALGVLLAEGRGVEADRLAATAWFSRAARNGDVTGMVEYAIALFNGDGIAPNEAEAARWFREAAFRGSAIAQNRLARLYVAGRGVPEDRVEAAAWHMLASARGLADPWLDETLSDLDETALAEARALAESRLAGS